MKSLTFFLIVFLSRTLLASPLEELREILFFKVNSYEEYERYNKYYLKLENLINSCRVEIRKNQFPHACFKCFLTIRRLNLKSDAIGVTLKEIDELCIKKSKTIENLGIIEYFLENRGVSKACREQLKIQKKILDYIRLPTESVIPTLFPLKKDV